MMALKKTLKTIGLIIISPIVIVGVVSLMLDRICDKFILSIKHSFNID